MKKGKKDKSKKEEEADALLFKQCAHFLKDIETGPSPKTEFEEISILAEKGNNIGTYHVRKVLQRQVRQRKAKYGEAAVIAFDLDCQNQKGTCGLCGEKADLCVDHDHTTNKYRGAICPSCNKGLGMFKDDPELLKRAIEYLEAHKEKHE